MIEYIDYFKSLFTPQQQVALSIITLAVIALTQVYKHVWFGLYPDNVKRRKTAKIWLFSFCAGFVCGLAGYFVAIPPQPLWFWLFCGVSSGAIAISVFKLAIELPSRFKRGDSN